MAKTKRPKIQHTRDHEGVVAELEKLGDLKQQLREMKERVDDLVRATKAERVGSVQFAARQLVGQAPAEAKNPSTELHELRREMEVVQRAITLQQENLNLARNRAIAEVHEQLQDRFDDRVLEIVNAIAAMWRATRNFERFLGEARLLGATYPLTAYQGIFKHSHLINQIIFPQPGQADRHYKQFLLHLKNVCPGIQTQIATLTKEVSKS